MDKPRNCLFPGFGPEVVEVGTFLPATVPLILRETELVVFDDVQTVQIAVNGLQTERVLDERNSFDLKNLVVHFGGRKISDGAD